MKRRRTLVVILLLLTGGAIVNVVVVVVISAYASRGSWAKVVYKSLDVHRRDAVVLQRGSPADSSDRTYKQYESRGFGWRSRMGNSTDQPISGDEGKFVYLRVFDAGWPMLALQGEHRSGNSAVLGPGFHNAWGRLRIVTSGPDKGMDNDMMPLWPIWPGFAINTGLYATIFWLLLVVPFALRRWRRIKRGLCVKCGYDLRGGRKQPSDSSVCPECGTAVAPQPPLSAASYRSPSPNQAVHRTGPW